MKEQREKNKQKEQKEQKKPREPSEPKAPVFSASMMCADLLELKETVGILNRECQIFHIDIMDGHFCGSIYLSPAFIKSMKPCARIPIEAHLMVAEPEHFLEEVIASGADIVTLHAETIEEQAFRMIERIHRAGCKAGIAVNPATPLSAVREYAGRAEILTIMTVDPGYAGQDFIPEMLEKIRLASDWKKEKQYHYVIQADGAVNSSTFGALYQAGAESFVMGSSGLFGLDPDLEKACIQMKQEFREAVQKEEGYAWSEEVKYMES